MTVRLSTEFLLCIRQVGEPCVTNLLREDVEQLHQEKALLSDDNVLLRKEISTLKVIVEQQAEDLSTCQKQLAGRKIISLCRLCVRKLMVMAGIPTVDVLGSLKAVADGAEKDFPPSALIAATAEDDGKVRMEDPAVFQHTWRLAIVFSVLTLLSFVSAVDATVITTSLPTIVAISLYCFDRLETLENRLLLWRKSLKSQQGTMALLMASIWPNIQRPKSFPREHLHS